MNGSNFRFFFLPCRYIPWRWSDCYRERKRLPFPFNSQWECEQTCYSHYMHLVIIDFFRVLESFPGPRLPMLTFQVRISFLGSQDTALLFLPCLCRICRFLNLATSQGSVLGITRGFILFEGLFHGKQFYMLRGRNYWIGQKVHSNIFHNVTFGQLNVS